MSDRKYRQRGYQDDPRDREPKRPAPEKREHAPRGQPPLAPRRPNMPGYRDVVRCARCGGEVDPFVGSLATCARCGSDLHTCALCVHFDTSARFECTQPIPARVSPKDVRNECTFFAVRVTVERETRSAAPSSARKAFDDLFK